MLGAVRRDAVLPARPGPLAAGDLRGPARSEGELKHLGITAPNRSTLAYANEHRPWQLYRAVFEALLLRCQPLAKGRRKFRFKNKLLSLDSTVIDLCATLFDWVKFRRTTGAVKLHCLLDHDGQFPSVVVITEGKRHDVRVARTLRFDPGTIVVMDRGYTGPRPSPPSTRMLADRAVLQGAEAEPQDQDLRRDQRQRPEGPDPDGADRYAAPQVSPAALPIRLVALEPRRPAPD